MYLAPPFSLLADQPQHSMAGKLSKSFFHSNIPQPEVLYSQYTNIIIVLKDQLLYAIQFQIKPILFSFFIN